MKNLMLDPSMEEYCEVGSRDLTKEALRNWFDFSYKAPNSEANGARVRMLVSFIMNDQEMLDE